MNRSIARGVLLSILVLSFTAASFGQIAVGISVRIGPPPLPVYAQPICPGPGYMWTPGYWAWSDDDGYYWVPGTWVVAPVGMLWTPGYWGWGDGLYVWHAGYWGPHIGFYGGINYGFGYTGVGFVGGEWRGGSFYYNRSVTNVSVTNVTNVYNRTVIVNNNHVAFNGGAGGVQARPTAEQERYAREPHREALSSQIQHEHAAAQNRQNFASENHGRPTIAATARPGDFSGRSAVAARSAGGEYHAPAMSPREARGSAGNRGGSNNGFRPFTPPNSSNSRNANPGQRNTESGLRNNSGFRNNSSESRSNPSGMNRGAAPRESNQRNNENGFRNSPSESNRGAAFHESNQNRGNMAPRESNQSRGNMAPRESNQNRGNMAPRESNQNRGNMAPRESNQNRGNMTPRESNQNRENNSRPSPPRASNPAPQRQGPPPKEAHHR